METTKETKNNNEQGRSIAVSNNRGQNRKM